MSSHALHAERVALDSLRADAKNARRHDAKNLEAIVDSLKQFGQVEPLVVQKSSGKVIGGNGRLEAMSSLGWTHASVVRLDIDDTKASALGIALNRTGELAEWDAGALEGLLSELKGSMDLTDLGFDDAELERLLGDDSFTSLPADEPARAPAPAGAPPAREDEGEGDGGVGDFSPSENPAAQGVKLVQLFYSAEQLTDFRALADRAQDALGTEHLSDTVLEALRRAVEDGEPAAE